MSWLNQDGIDRLAQIKEKTGYELAQILPWLGFVNVTNLANQERWNHHWNNYSPVPSRESWVGAWARNQGDYAVICGALDPRDGLVKPTYWLCTRGSEIYLPGQRVVYMYDILKALGLRESSFFVVGSNGDVIVKEVKYNRDGTLSYGYKQA